MTALIAALAAFSIYLAVRYWVLGGLDTPGSALGPNALSSPSNAIGLAFVGVFPCWWLLRDRDGGRTRWY